MKEKRKKRVPPYSVSPAFNLAEKEKKGKRKSLQKKGRAREQTI